MTIVSKGYAGPVTSEDWASLVRGLPKRYWVEHSSSAQPTIVTGVDRTVRIGLGKVGGWGIFDEVTATEDIQINQDLPTAGNTKWYLVVLRRDWGLSTTTIEVITGTATEALPVRQQTPGTGQDDQPLALVQITGGTSEPTALRDLRLWGGEQGFMQAATGSNLLFQQYATWQGSMIRFNNTMYSYTQALAGQGTAGVWVILTNEPIDASNSITVQSGWSLVESSLIRNGKQRVLSFEVQRTGSTIASNSSGQVSDTQVLSVQSTDYPDFELPVSSFARAYNAVSGDGPFTVGASCNLTTNGNVYIIGMAPNQELRDNGSLHGTVTYYVGF